MYTLIEIAYAISQHNVEAAIQHSFKESNNSLIGRSLFEETDEALLVVLLTHPNMSEHRNFLKHLLQQGMITSFEYRYQYLVTAFFDPPLDVRMKMQEFPLRPGESWFPAINHPGQVYICLERHLMTAEQAAWMLNHQVRWAYYESYA